MPPAAPSACEWHSDGTGHNLPSFSLMLPAGCGAYAYAGKKLLLREEGRREFTGSKDDNRRSLPPLGDKRERRY